MPLADKILLTEKDQHYPQHTIIERGYGCLVVGRKHFYFEVAQAPDFFQQIIDPNCIGGVANLPEYIPQVEFETEEPEMRVRAASLKPITRYRSALIKVGPDTDGRVGAWAPSLKNDLYPYPGTPQKVADGYYIAAIYPAINERQSRYAASPYLYKMKKSYSQGGEDLQNLRGLAVDSQFLTKFLDWLLTDTKNPHSPASVRILSFFNTIYEPLSKLEENVFDEFQMAVGAWLKRPRSGEPTDFVRYCIHKCIGLPVLRGIGPVSSPHEQRACCKEVDSAVYNCFMQPNRPVPHQIPSFVSWCYTYLQHRIASPRSPLFDDFRHTVSSMLLENSSALSLTQMHRALTAVEYSNSLDVVLANLVEKEVDSFAQIQTDILDFYVYFTKEIGGSDSDFPDVFREGVLNWLIMYFDVFTCTQIDSLLTSINYPNPKDVIASYLWDQKELGFQKLTDELSRCFGPEGVESVEDLERTLSQYYSYFSKFILNNKTDFVKRFYEFIEDTVMGYPIRLSCPQIHSFLTAVEHPESTRVVTDYLFDNIEDDLSKIADEIFECYDFLKQGSGKMASHISTDFRDAVTRKLIEPQTQIRPNVLHSILHSIEHPDVARLVAKHLFASIGDDSFEQTATNIAQCYRLLLESAGGDKSADKITDFREAIQVELKEKQMDLKRHEILSILAGIQSPTLSDFITENFDDILCEASIKVFDIESDGKTIFELGIMTGGRVEVFESQSEITAALAAAQDDAEDFLWIGHGIKEWDIPVLKKAGLDLFQCPQWDTLRVEALLSPLSDSFAFRTKHHADPDVRVTYELFKSQLLRLISGHEGTEFVEREVSWAGLVKMAPAVFSQLKASKPDFTITSAGRKMVMAKKKLLHESICRDKSLIKRLKEELSTRREGTVHVVIPDYVASDLARFSNMHFFGFLDQNYSKIFDPLAAKKLEDDSRYEASLIVTYCNACAKEHIQPVVAFMADWIRMKAEGIIDIDTLCIDISENPGTTSGEVLCFSSTDYFVASKALPESLSVPSSIILVYPSLMALTTKKLIADLDRVPFEDFLAKHDRWPWFGPAQSFHDLPRDFFDELSQVFGIDPIDSTMDNLWIEKTVFGTYRVWGNCSNLPEAVLDVFPDADVGHIDVQEDSWPRQAQIEYAVLDIPKDRKKDLDTVRLNPQSTYRNNYWATQSFITDYVARGVASILFINEHREIEKLEAFFTNIGYNILRNGTVARRLERLLDGRSDRRMIIAPFDDLRAYAAHTTEEPVNFVVDALPIGEQWVLNKRVADALTEEEDKDADDPEDIFDGEDPTATVDEDAGDETGDAESAQHVSTHLLRHDVVTALSSYYPCLVYLYSRVYESHSKNRLFILDPRLQPFRSLPESPRLRPVHVPIWSSRDEYEIRLGTAEKCIGSVKPPSRLDWSDDWETTLQHIFLAGKGPRGTTGDFTDDQKRYLKLIMERERDILVVLPTGGGKSVLFQGPALYRGLATNKLTLVISPLKALMVDQVAGLSKLGFWNCVDCATSDLARFEIEDIYRRLAGGEIVMLFVAPERFRSRGFLNALEYRLSMDGQEAEYWVFDEAHCISQWGLDFRPDYLHAAQYVNDWRRNKSSQPPALFLSATMTEQVLKDLERIFS
ncbi:MAG: DEAD/DEAH box helicase [Deltaproteobacteria bacterium]|nr:DEAD/DEAH box helicase [Deltaproteobacteria bacterium]